MSSLKVQLHPGINKSLGEKTREKMNMKQITIIFCLQIANNGFIECPSLTKAH